MPTYSYMCPNDHKFDLNKPIKDMDRKEKCSACGAAASRQITFPQAIVIN